MGYGLALWLLARGLLPHAGLGLLPATTVFTTSYLAGFLALFAPGGIGVREGALVATMQRAGLATPAEAAVIAVASRIWLTVLEIIPGLIALLIPTTRRAASAGPTASRSAD
jgi:uncharacterized membrane protein YbhN (UPF0104 family)